MVKSAYELACKWCLSEPSSPHSQHGQPSSLNALWNNFWNAAVPLKIRVGMWKMVWNSVPMRLNVRRKGLPVEKSCVICGRERESIFHLLFQCPFVRRVLEETHINLNMIGVNEDDVEEGIKRAMGRAVNRGWKIDQANRTELNRPENPRTD